jgi:hypothetical protein
MSSGSSLSRRIDLDEVAAGVAQVELRRVAGQLEEVVAERVVVVGADLARAAVHGREVVDREGEVVMARRVRGALEEVDLRVAEAQPLHGHAEVRRRDPARAEEVLVPGDRGLEVRRVDADVVDARGAHDGSSLSAAVIPVAGGAAAGSRDGGPAGT